MSNAVFWRNLSKDCFEHSGQMLIALDHVLACIPDPDGAGQEAHDLLKMIRRLEAMHNAEICQEINCLEKQVEPVPAIKKAA